MCSSWKKAADYNIAFYCVMFGGFQYYQSWRKRSIPTHSGWLYPLTFDAGKGLKEA